MEHLKYQNLHMSRQNNGRFTNQQNGHRQPRPSQSHVTRPILAAAMPMQVWNHVPAMRNSYPVMTQNVTPSKPAQVITSKEPETRSSSSQTDFPKEIADLHLKQLPNTLYLSKNKLTQENINGLKKVDTLDACVNIPGHSGALPILPKNNVINSGTHPRGSNHKRTISTDFSKRNALIDPETTPVSAETQLQGRPIEIEAKTPETIGIVTKKKRKRNRKKKKVQPDNDENKQSDSHNIEDEVNISLHLEDEFEFPDLASSKRTAPSVADNHAKILNQTDWNQVNGAVEGEEDADNESVSFEGGNDGNNQFLFKQAAETKSARKRRRRRDQANKAANDEMAEISIEQQMLQELGLKAKKDQTSTKEPQLPVTNTPTQTPKTAKPNNTSGKNNRKSNQPIALDFAAMIDALEQKRDDAITTKNAPKKHIIRKKVKPELEPPRRPHNPLDSTCPKVKRGKEREFPKPKKPSPLKKVILKEREEKKRMRLLEEDPAVVGGGSQVCVGVVNPESDLSQDEDKGKGSASAELSPVSQTSPFSMSPLSPSASPLQSGFNSPVAKDAQNPALLKIHSRRYREYCTQILDKDIDNCCLQFLQNLVRYQDKQYHKDPKKAKAKRRIVLGLREVTKHLKLQKIRCVIISPNLEKIQSKGGLDDALNNILNMCTEQDVPYVFALGRRALGRACAKLVPVSVVGVFNFEGSERQFWRLIELTQKATDSYKEMVSIVEKDLQENPNTRGGPSNVPNLFAHMGHSRTPSGCSAISFTSSILSEPISENYPYSEPETDSKGYEVSKRSHVSGIQSSVISEQSSATYETDAGNEADTEDYLEPVEDTKSPQPYFNHNGDSQDEEDDPDNIEDLPHIDSIHYGNYDLSVEILSQHSSRTIENSEAMSTHSSRTLREGSPTTLLEKFTEKHSLSSTQQKVIDKDRIKSWVEATQSVGEGGDASRLETCSADEDVCQRERDTLDEELCDNLQTVEKEVVS